MSEEIQHLGTHRRLILGRALLAGLAGLVPVPYIDDLLAGGVRSSLVKRLAQLRHVDVDGNAVAALCTPHGSRLLSPLRRRTPCSLRRRAAGRSYLTPASAARRRLRPGPSPRGQGLRTSRSCLQPDPAVWQSTGSVFL